MLLQEFERFTGFAPAAEYFNKVICPEYMSSPLSKEAWCKKWKKEGGIQRAYDAMTAEAAKAKRDFDFASDQAATLLLRKDDYKAELEDMRQYNEELVAQFKIDTRERTKLLEFLVSALNEDEPKSLIRNEVITLMGTKAYIVCKLDHGYQLSVEDCSLLAEYLKNGNQL